MKFWGQHKLFFTDGVLINLALLYLLFPLILFGFGWLRFGFALLFLFTLIFSALKSFQRFDNNQYELSPKKFYLIFIIILILFFWILLSGIGGIGLQNWDFHGRNAIFRDLITHSWPVQYDYTNQPQMSDLFGSGGYLIYYFSFFLPAALVGKIIGWTGANYFLIFWSVVGVIITIFLIFKHINNVSIWVVLSFIFFSGMDFLGSSRLVENPTNTICLLNCINFQLSFFYKILSNVVAANQLEWWAVIFQYSSITTQLYFVFNQCIPAWIITLLIIDQKNSRNIFFYYSILIFYGPFPFIGLFPVVAYKFFKITKKEIQEALYSDQEKISYISYYTERKPSWLTFQNLIGGSLTIIVGSIFLYSNVGKHENGFIWNFHPNIISLFFVYLIFCLVEFLILGLVLVPLRSTKKSLLLVIGLLLVFPLYKYGLNNDFVMRASIPAILILFIMAIKTLTLKNNIDNVNQKIFFRIIVIIILLIGSITPLHEIYRSVNSIYFDKSITRLYDNWVSLDYGGDEEKIETMPNFIVSSSPTPIFFRYFGK